MKYETVIWDFNGTVLDDTGISINSINTVMKKRGMKLLENKSELQNVFCFPVKEYYRALGFDFEKEPFETPADEWVALYDEKKFSAPLTDGVEYVLKTLHDAGVRQIIMSVSEKELLTAQLASHDILKYFDEIAGTNDFYAVGKTELAEKWAAENSDIPRERILFVGDTDHDYMCACKIGCDCVLYSGGFMSKERLSATGSAVIDSLDMLVPIVLS